MQSFRKEYFKQEKDNSVNLSGKNILIKEILKQYLRQFIKVEKHFTPFHIKDLEKNYSGSIAFQVNGKEKQISFKGNIDRIDENRDGVRIIDYKTGGADMRFNSVESLFEATGNHDALQAMVYSIMYKQTYGSNKALNPGLYAIRELFNSNFDYKLKLNKNQFKFDEVEEEVKDGLRRILSEIFNPEVPFTQTDDLNICRNCPYKKICRRD